MKHSVYFAYPGDLEAKTGGYGYDRKVISELRNLGWHVDLVPLGAGYPFPDHDTILRTEEMLGALPEKSLVLIDGLAYGALGDIAKRLAQRITFIALVHHPLASEGNITEQEQSTLLASERLALKHASTVFVTSSSTCQQLIENYDVPGAKIVVAKPGTEQNVQAERTSQVPIILSVGSIIPRKGYDVLVAALNKIKHLAWECRIVGSRTMDAHCDATLQQQIIENQLSDRVVLVGQIDDVRSEFTRSDIFALASRYEGYGMVFAEALSLGLPIVACDAGAVSEVVPADAGILVAPDDSDAFANALKRIVTDRELANGMAEASFRQSKLLPSWTDTGKLFSEVLEKAANERI
ncbi:glycosyltransferase family 4 protein [Phyllobacterium sp. YR531]|uniref:glycosyltransferase family 4 protein n=1 Tax=Phyllobacterium sp. YR531 TaxID=1144343 RepID=UPI00026FA188|nr:glycosyltransferase family 4 protein [Phyllobacterium sp. YR531]EJN02231.1 glycosyltransferase [Phyllobacterium sp. YR531]